MNIVAIVAAAIASSGVTAFILQATIFRTKPDENGKKPEVSTKRQIFRIVCLIMLCVAFFLFMASRHI